VQVSLQKRQCHRKGFSYGWLRQNAILRQRRKPASYVKWMTVIRFKEILLICLIPGQPCSLACFSSKCDLTDKMTSVGFTSVLTGELNQDFLEEKFKLLRILLILMLIFIL
jgi:hypothetical protein